VLALGVESPRPDSHRPRALEFVSAERPPPCIAIRGEKRLGLLDGGKPLCVRSGRKQGGGEADEDVFTVGGRAVPVVYDQQLIAAPAQIPDQPVAMADHGLGRACSQPVTGNAPGMVDPIGTGDLVEVDVGVLWTGPKPGLGVVPRRP
jgi:hypothetical protein